MMKCKEPYPQTNAKTEFYRIKLTETVAFNKERLRRNFPLPESTASAGKMMKRQESVLKWKNIKT